MRKCRNWQTSKTKDLVAIAVVWVQVPSSALIKKDVKYIPFLLLPKQAPAKQCLVFIFSYISTISSAIFKVDSLCETIIIVFPSLLSLRDFNIIPSLSESRLLVGSSRSISGAS
jgi:hypothetical protein